LMVLSTVMTNSFFLLLAIDAANGVGSCTDLSGDCAVQDDADPTTLMQTRVHIGGEGIFDTRMCEYATSDSEIQEANTKYNIQDCRQAVFCSVVRQSNEMDVCGKTCDLEPGECQASSTGHRMGMLDLVNNGQPNMDVVYRVTGDRFQQCKARCAMDSQCSWYWTSSTESHAGRSCHMFSCPDDAEFGSCLRDAGMSLSAATACIVPKERPDMLNSGDFCKESRKYHSKDGGHCGVPMPLLETHYEPMQTGGVICRTANSQHQDTVLSRCSSNFSQYIGTWVGGHGLHSVFVETPLLGMKWEYQGGEKGTLPVSDVCHCPTAVQCPSQVSVEEYTFDVSLHREQGRQFIEVTRTDGKNIKSKVQPSKMLASNEWEVELRLDCKC